MEVGLPAVRRSQHRASRKMVLRQLEPQRSECRKDILELLEFDDHVDILVRASLLLEQSIHAPSAVEPHPQAPGLQDIEDSQHLASSH